jgi:hypothetical protein
MQPGNKSIGLFVDVSGKPYGQDYKTRGTVRDLFGGEKIKEPELGSFG